MNRVRKPSDRKWTSLTMAAMFVTLEFAVLATITLAPQASAAPLAVELGAEWGWAMPSDTGVTYSFSVTNPLDESSRDLERLLVSVDTGSGITWDATQSTFEGDEEFWTPTVSTGGSSSDCAGGVSSSCDSLIFDFKDEVMQPGDEWTLTLVFDVAASPTVEVGDLIPVRISGVTAGLVQTAVADYTIAIDDQTSPTLIYAEVRDQDVDGHLDTVYMEFDKELDPETVRRGVADFRIGGSTEYTALSASYTPGTATTNASVEVKILESLEFDTGAQPAVKIKKGTILSFAHIEVDSQSIDQPVDAAPPVLVSAVSAIGSKRVTVTFSEDVTDETGAALTANVFGFLDNGQSDCDNPPPTTPPPYNLLDLPTYSPTAVVSHTLDDGNFATITELRQNPSGNGFGTCDMAWVAGEGLQPYPDYVVGLNEDTSPNGHGIRDLAGNKIVYRTFDTSDITCCHVPVDTVRMVTVDGNIGFKKVTIKFNAPVEIDLDKELWAQAFTVVDGKGPSGVVFVDTEKCSDTMIATLDQNLEPEDVSGDPTFIRVSSGVVKACERDEIRVLEQEVAMVDVTRPTIVSAYTKDLDEDGIIDAYALTFSEPVDDSSFIKGDPGGTDATGHPVLLDVEGHDGYDILTGLTPENATADDRFVVITFAQNGYGTGEIPELTTIAEGLFYDLAVNPETGVGNPMDVITSDDLIEQDGANPRVDRAWTVDEDLDGLLDGFRIQFTEAIDDSTLKAEEWNVGNVWPPEDTFLKPASERYLPNNDDYPVIGINIDINGKDIRSGANDNTIILRFEERPNDPKNPHGDTGDPVPQLTYRDHPVAAVFPGIFGSIQDHSGNPMKEFSVGAVDEEDGAIPVMMGAFACLGTDQLFLVFSEGVGVKPSSTQPLRPVKDEDFFYGNGNKADVSGFVEAGVTHELGKTVAYATVDTKFTGADLSNDFISYKQDTSLLPDAKGVVQEVNGDLHVDMPEVGVGIPLQEAEDFTPPEPIQEVAQIAGSVTANSVRYSWIVPEDVGCLDAGVSGYDIRVSKEPITNENFDDADPVPAQDIELTWYDDVKERTVAGTPDAGGVQEVTISGLTPETLHFIAIKPMDKHGNKADKAVFTTVQTTADPTPPERPSFFNITSSVYEPGVPSKSTRPAFSWDKVIDPESGVVTYRYLIDGEADSVPDDTFPGTRSESIAPNGTTLAAMLDGEGLAPSDWRDGPNTWYFHLSACSGGGCTELGHYKFLVDPLVNTTEMKALNSGFPVNATVLEGAYTVTWGFPEDLDLPVDENGDELAITGVQIWRRDPVPNDGSGSGLEGLAASERLQENYTFLGQYGRNDHVFRSGEFQDTDKNATTDSRYLVTLVVGDGFGAYPPDEGPTASEYEGVKVLELHSDPVIPMWVWITLGVLLLLVIIGVVLFFVLREPAEAEHAYELDELDEQEFEGNPFGDEGWEEAGEEGSGNDLPGAAQGVQGDAGQRPPGAS